MKFTHCHEQLDLTSRCSTAGYIDVIHIVARPDGFWILLKNSEVLVLVLNAALQLKLKS